MLKTFHYLSDTCGYKPGFPCGSVVENLPALQEPQETQVWSLGEEGCLERKMASHSSILAGKFHGQRRLVGYSPWGHKELDTGEWLSTHTGMDISHGAKFMDVDWSLWEFAASPKWPRKTAYKKQILITRHYYQRCFHSTNADYSYVPNTILNTGDRIATWINSFLRENHIPEGDYIKQTNVLWILKESKITKTVVFDDNTIKIQ